MHKKINVWVVAAGAVVCGAPSFSMACDVTPAETARIKKVMAGEIAFRLGLRPEQVPLDAIGTPQLHAPVVPDGHCAPSDSYHHSANFTVRIAPEHPAKAPAANPAAAAPARWPGHGREPSPDRLSRKRMPSVKSRIAGISHVAHGHGYSGRWPQYHGCAYVGVAVVLGGGHSGPVAVNFKRKCH